MGITLWIATQTIGLHTQLAANAGALKAGGQVASLDQGGSPITRLLIQLLPAEYRRLRRHCHYLSGRRTADWRRARQFVAAEKATALQQSQIAS